MVIEAGLRVAVCTDGPIVSWQARCVEKLAAVPGVVLDHWVQLSTHRLPGSGPKDSGALALAPVPDALRALSPAEHGVSSPGGPEPAHRIDVLLDLSSRGHALPVSWADEVWHFAYGSTLCRDPAAAALVDYVRGPGVTRLALVTEPTGAVVRDGWLRTVSWWVGKPLESLLLDPVDWPAIAARNRIAPDPLKRMEPPSPGTGATHGPAEPVERQQRLGSLPRTVLGAAAVGRRVLELADAISRHHEWNVGIMQAPIGSLLAPSKEPSVTWLPGRVGHFAADPFGVERDGILHIFFEDFSRREGKGSIAHVSVAPDGTMSDPAGVLDLAVHASYPFLVEHEGSVFMLPETAAAGELALYEAVEFPHRWRRAVTLLPGTPAVDASLVEHAGRWWMFAGIHGRGHNQNLFVWHAPQPTGPWTPHAGNPVKTDACSARPGGTPFVSAGKLFRPSQDGSRRYGGRVVLNQVDVLTPSSFAERSVGFVEPRRGSRYPDGLHTISGVGDRTLIDGNALHFVRGDVQKKVAARVHWRASSR